MSGDEPRIKKSLRPEIEERLPPHLDKEHYEIVHHEGLRDYTIPDESEEYRPRREMVPRIYFHLCFVLLIVLVIETATFSYLLLESERDREQFWRELQSEKGEKSNLKGELEKLNKRITELESENNILKSENVLSEEEDKNISDLQHIRISPDKLEAFSRLFKFICTFTDTGLGGNISISITCPEELYFNIFDIESENLSIMIKLEGSDLNKIIMEKTKVSCRETMNMPEYVINELKPGYYEVIVIFSDGMKTVKLTIYRLKIVESTQNC